MALWDSDSRTFARTSADPRYTSILTQKCFLWPGYTSAILPASSRAPPSRPLALSIRVHRVPARPKPPPPLHVSLRVGAVAATGCKTTCSIYNGEARHLPSRLPQMARQQMRRFGAYLCSYNLTSTIAEGT